MFNRVKILLFCRRKNPVYVVRIEKEDNHLPVPVSAEEIALKHAIDEIYTRYPFYGSRRVTVELRQNRQIKAARELYYRIYPEADTCPSQSAPQG